MKICSHEDKKKHIERNELSYRATTLAATFTGILEIQIK